MAEYGQWARSLSERGHLASGEKLKPGGRDLSGGGDSTDPLQGFFILSADSMEAAEALARTCPHLRYGGRIALREIDPT